MGTFKRHELQETDARRGTKRWWDEESQVHHYVLRQRNIASQRRGKARLRVAGDFSKPESLSGLAEKRLPVQAEKRKPSWDDFRIPLIGSIVGTTSGEADRDSVPGGWEGTDDATSTAPSDLNGMDVNSSPDLNKEVDRMWNDTEIFGTDTEEELQRKVDGVYRS